MNKLEAKLTVSIYSFGKTSTVYLSGHKENEIITLDNYDLSFKILEIDNDYIIIDFEKDNKRFEITNNKILLKREIKLVDTLNNNSCIYIRLDSIN